MADEMLSYFGSSGHDDRMKAFLPGGQVDCRERYKVTAKAPLSVTLMTLRGSQS